MRVTVFGEQALSGEDSRGQQRRGGDAAGRQWQQGGADAGVRSRRGAENTATGMVKEPKVSADRDCLSPLHYILGEVSKPGRYPYAIGLTGDEGGGDGRRVHLPGP